MTFARRGKKKDYNWSSPHLSFVSYVLVQPVCTPCVLEAGCSKDSSLIYHVTPFSKQPYVDTYYFVDIRLRTKGSDFEMVKMPTP